MNTTNKMKDSIKNENIDFHTFLRVIEMNICQNEKNFTIFIYESENWE